jgi:Sugar phosphate permease
MTSKSKSGIFYGWVMVAAGFIICLVVYGSMYSYGVFFGSLCEEFHWTRTTVSAGWSIFMAVHCGMSFVAGMVNDKYGPRRSLLILAIFLAIGFVLMSRINAIWQLYLCYGVIIGIGMSFGQLPILSTLTRWFVERRGMAVGIASAGIGAGTIVMAPLSQFLILRFDWRTAFLILAGIIVIVVVPISQLLLKSDPSEKGLLPYGYGKQAESKTSRNPVSPEGGSYTLKEALKKKNSG